MLCCRGRSGLLYSSLELTSLARQMSQAVLLQQEASLVRQAFNQQFEATQAAKRDLIAAVEEKQTRIEQIEWELGLHGSAPHVSVLVHAWELIDFIVLEKRELHH